MLVRKDHQDSSKYLVDALIANPNVERRFKVEVLEIHGKPGKLEQIIILDHGTREKITLPGAAMFIFIGAHPQSEIVKDLVMVDNRGFILTGPDLLKEGKHPQGWPLDRDPLILETSVPGIFAAGDVRLGTNHRVASAVGEGGIAIAAIESYLGTL
jgi:thioredoxin reductase (NADPH)